MTKRLIFLLISAGLLFFSGGEIWARMESTNYVIWADAFSSGGSEDSSSANYGIQDTIGESVILSATATAATYGIKAGFREMYPDQYLSFSIADPAIELGELTDSTTGRDSHTMVIDTNAVGGFVITVFGSTLTSGTNSIDALLAATASSPGLKQFGINLVANTSPLIGADPSGTAPIGSAATGYNTANQFKFASGNTVASATNDISQTTFTVSYIANISTDTAGGTYTTTLTYSATSNF
ncbi:MAG: hypothetical protein WC675_03235 [Patescibacteria group bacterium]|jgi:hypothetical protein